MQGYLQVLTKEGCFQQIPLASFYKLQFSTEFPVFGSTHKSHTAYCLPADFSLCIK